VKYQTKSDYGTPRSVARAGKPMPLKLENTQLTPIGNERTDNGGKMLKKPISLSRSECDTHVLLDADDYDIGTVDADYAADGGKDGEK